MAQTRSVYSGMATELKQTLPVHSRKNLYKGLLFLYIVLGQECVCDM